MERTKEALTNRLLLYEKADVSRLRTEYLFVEHIEQRRAVFVKWQREDMTKDLLHMCYVKGWERLREIGAEMDHGFGAIVRRSSIEKECPFEKAGSVFFMPKDAPELEDELVFPEGDYLCMYRYGMPYRSGPLYEFWNAIFKGRVETEGDILSVCLLDTTFHTKDRKEDMCQFQVRLV